MSRTHRKHKVPARAIRKSKDGLKERALKSHKQHRPNLRAALQREHGV